MPYLPGFLRLTPIDRPQPPPAPADACLPVSDGWLAHLQAGSTIKFFDARGSARSMQVMEAVGASWWAESVQTAYIHAGLCLYRSHSAGSAPGTSLVDQTRVGELPARPQAIVLRQGVDNAPESVIFTAEAQTSADAPGVARNAEGKSRSALHGIMRAIECAEIIQDFERWSGFWPLD